MPRGNKSFIHNATKKAKTNHDRHKLDYIEAWLAENNYGVHVSKSNHRFDNPDFFNKPKNHESDLILNEKVHVQHDTIQNHCELGFEIDDSKNENIEKKRVRTLKRNMGYWKANIPFFVINEDLANLLNIDEGALCVYLYFHSLMLKNARDEVEKFGRT
jgi:hypothetical protein